MRKLTTITATASVAVGGLLLGGALLPAGAATTDPGTGTSTPDAAGGASFLKDRLARLKEALAGLVEDGTLTQDQADAVAQTLNESDALGPHGAGRGVHHDGGPLALDAAAEALGLTEADVLDALRSGTSLADLAEQQGVEVATLVDALVAAASARIDEAVAAGDLDQDRADELRSQLEERLTDAVEQVPGMRHGMGHHGGGWGDDESATEDGSGAEDGAGASSTSLRGAVRGPVFETV